MLVEVQECFINIVCEIVKCEFLFIVIFYFEEVCKQIIGMVNMDNVCFLKCDMNDIWVCDYGVIILMDIGGVSLLDFIFNGWGEKFEVCLDNQIICWVVEVGVLKG